MLKILRISKTAIFAVSEALNLVKISVHKIKNHQSSEPKKGLKLAIFGSLAIPKIDFT